MKWPIGYLEFSYHTNHGLDLLHELNVYLRKPVNVYLDQDRMVLEIAPGRALTMHRTSKECLDNLKDPYALRVELTCEENASQVLDFLEMATENGTIQSVEHEISLEA